MHNVEYVERTLFILGEPNTGKSTPFRSMLRDCRMGGNIPTGNTPIKRVWALSNERRLYIRLTSPHEYGDDR